ncbi:MAG TPA: hemerythrin family protein [Gallionella sp.]
MISDWSRSRRSEATKLAWSRAMSVGNKTIDAEHAEIIRLVNEVERAIRSREADVLSRVFNTLETKIISHFANEARIAEAVGYPFGEHQLEHQYVLGELETMKTDLIAKNGMWSESAAEFYYSFLGEWATAHINVDDMKLKAKLETRPYDFKPNTVE